MKSNRVLRALPGVPVAVAFVFGIALEIGFGQRALDPDVIEFHSLAQHMTLGTVFGGVREPLWPVILILPVRMLGDQSVFAIRFLGLCGFVFMVLAFQLLVREMFGRTWSIVAATILACSPWLVYQAVRGLREETAAGLVLMFCWALVRPGLDGRRIVRLFALAGIAGLLRWDAMVVMLPVLGLTLLLRRPRLVVWVAGPVLTLALVAPLLIGNYLTHGDPLYHNNIHARFYRNVEFHDRPGYVTSEQMKTNSFAGPQITWAQYVFGLHSPGELAKRALVAFEMIPVRLFTEAIFVPRAQFLLPQLLARVLRTVAPVVSTVIWLVSAIGAILLLRSRAWPVPVMLGEIVLLYSPIATIIDYRLVLSALPLLCICVLESIGLAFRQYRVRRHVASAAV